VSSTPEPWKSAMTAKAISSERDLARRTDIAPTTIGAMIRGTRRTSPSNLRKVADVLGVDVEKVTAWAGQAIAALGPYEPPARSELLSPTQRQALNAVITAMLEGREEGSRHEPAANTLAPADEPVKLDDRRRTSTTKRTAARRAKPPRQT
jgi:transcriptional regulator with XRE-family HTH domain